MATWQRANPLMRTGKLAAIAFYLCFALFPLYWLIKIAVTPDRLIYTEGTALWPSEFTIGNFTTVIWQTDFLRFFGNSLIVSLSTAAIATLIAAGAGYAFSRFDFRGKRLVIALMLLTQMFPLLMIIAPIYRIIAAMGLLNSLSSLILVYIAFNIPFATFLMQSFFDGIPKDLEDAAMMDGCTRFQSLRKVILPQTLPGILGGAVIVFIPSVGNFIVPDVLGGAKGLMIGNLVEQQFLSARNWPFGAALSVIIMTVVLTVLMVSIARATRRGGQNA